MVLWELPLLEEHAQNVCDHLSLFDIEQCLLYGSSIAMIRSPGPHMLFGVCFHIDVFPIWGLGLTWKLLYNGYIYMIGVVIVRPGCCSGHVDNRGESINRRGETLTWRPKTLWRCSNTHTNPLQVCEYYFQTFQPTFSLCCPVFGWMESNVIFYYQKSR